MKIEKDIPAPVGGPSNLKYPFHEMEVGDSIFFADEPQASQSKPVIAARNFARTYGRKVVSRSEGTGVRIWRIK